MDKHVIALVGLPGAGKTVAVNHIFEKTRWPKVYFGSPVFEELERRQLPVSEKNERAVREELRGTHGMAAMAILSLPKIEKLLNDAPAVIVESLYSWEEYLVLKEKFGGDFKVIAIYASPATRIARLSHRPERPLTAAEVESRDCAQIENLHQAGPIARAEYTIVNEGPLEDMHQSLDVILASISES